MKNINNKDNYWNEFYSDRASLVPELPSQFAAFVASEMVNKAEAIIDLGCGNGRDSYFFTQYGFPVLAIDSSSAAIENCRKKLSLNSIQPSFVEFDLNNKELLNHIRLWLNGNEIRSAVMYARFFLHAISDYDEQSFIKLIQQLCSEFSIFLAFEFRTKRDIGLNKETDQHFRRYIDETTFLARWISNGFEPIYVTNGFGYAKFREDDAHISRCILKRY